MLDSVSPGEPYHEQSLDPYTDFMDQTYLFGQHLQVGVLAVLGEKVLIPGFHTKADHPAPGFFHHPGQGEIYMLGPDGTVKSHPQRLINHHPGEGLDPFTIKGELVVIEVDVPDMKTIVGIFQMFIKVVGGIVPETAPEHGTVTVTAGIGASPAGYAAGIGDRRIIENGQLVGLRITV